MPEEKDEEKTHWFIALAVLFADICAACGG